MTVKPISPGQIKDSQANRDFPDEVIEAFNELITKEWNGSSARIDQDTVVSLILDKMVGEQAGEELRNETRKKLFANKWLDIEPKFRKSEWKVEYDKPCYWGGDNYEPHWVFERKSQLRGS